MTDLLTASDYRALAAFRHQLRRFLLFSENAARAAGLRPRQHQALLAIKGASRATVGALAETLGIKPHSAAGLANRLVAAGLVWRVVDSADRRRVHLVLTAMAEERLTALTIAHRAELKRLACLWGPLFRALAREGLVAVRPPRVALAAKAALAESAVSSVRRPRRIK